MSQEPRHLDAVLKQKLAQNPEFVIQSASFEQVSRRSDVGL